MGYNDLLGVDAAAKNSDEDISPSLPTPPNDETSDKSVEQPVERVDADVKKDVSIQPPQQTSAHPHIRTSAQTDAHSYEQLLEHIDIETIRRAIREENNRTGNRSFSQSEQDLLDDLVHHLKRQGYRQVNANLIVRILINALKQDVERLGDQTFVHEVIRSMY